MNISLRKIAELLVLFIGVVATVYAWQSTDLYPPWIRFHAEAASFAGVVIICLHQISSTRGNIFFPRKIYYFVALLVMGCFRYFQEDYLYSGDLYIFILYVFGVFVALTLGGNLTNDNISAERWLLIAAFVVTVSSLSSAIIAMLQWLQLDEGVDWILKIEMGDRPFANFSQANHFALHLVTGIVSVIYIYKKINFSKFLFYLIAFLLFFGLILSQSRTGLLSTGCTIVWLAMKGENGITQTPKWRTSVDLILILLLTVLVVNFLNIYIDYGGVRGLKEHSDIGLRPKIWEYIYNSGFENLLNGWGIGGISQSQMRSGFDLDSISFTYWSHNIILDLWINFGLIPVIFCSISILLWLYKKYCKTKDVEIWYAQAMLIPFILSSLLEFSFAYMYFLLPAAVFVGYLSEIDNGDRIALEKWKYFLILIIGSCFSLKLWWDYVHIETNFRSARFERKFNQPKNPKNSSSYVSMLNQLDGLMLQVSFEKNQRNLLPILKKSIERYPNLPGLITYGLAISDEKELVWLVCKTQQIKNGIEFKVFAKLVLDEKLEIIKNCGLINHE